MVVQQPAFAVYNALRYTCVGMLCLPLANGTIELDALLRLAQEFTLLDTVVTQYNPTT